MKHFTCLPALFLLALSGALSALAYAQSPSFSSGQAASTAASTVYPIKIVRVVIPWPGGSNDAAGRLVFQKIAES